MLPHQPELALICQQRSQVVALFVKFRLFTTIYPEKNPERRREYRECLQRNLDCPWIAEVCLLVEGDHLELPDSPKIRIRRIAQRPDYSDFFTWIDQLAGTDDVSAIANTDIYLDGTMLAGIPLLGGRVCLALARWESGSLFDRNDSQDCWVFRGPVMGVSGHFPLGVVRCDNRILYELQQADYRVLNPAFSIRVHHLHQGQRGEYGDTQAHFVQPPYRYLWPHNLHGPLRTAVLNLWHPEQRIGWRFDQRRWQRSVAVRAWRKLFPSA